MDTDTPTKVAPVDALVDSYVKLRDVKAKLKAEYDLQVGPVEQAMDKIEARLLTTLDSQGVEAFKTASGTAFKTTKTTCGVADWDAFFQFVRANGYWNMLNHAANKTAVDEYRQAHNDLPPGVNWRVERCVQVRRT